MNDDLFALHAYNRWADDRIVAAIRQLTPEQYTQEPVPGWASVRSSLVHIAGATWLWACRLREENVTALPTETEVSTLDDAVRLLAQGHDAFDQLLAVTTPGKLAAIWTTRDPRGNERQFPYWIAYRHVVNHATYHRGQIASKLRRLGVTPPITDMIWWVIEQTPNESK